MMCVQGWWGGHECVADVHLHACLLHTAIGSCAGGLRVPPYDSKQALRGNQGRGKASRGVSSMRPHPSLPPSRP